MEISARSYLTAGVSLTAATAIAFAPLAVQENHHTVALPRVTTADVHLTATPADIAAFVAGIQSVLDDADTTAAGVAGVPGQALIGVASGIATLFDVGFTGLIEATDDPTIAASLTILKALSVDAYDKLAENLGRINPVITGTTAQVGELLTTALTGSLQNILIAAANVIENPLSLTSYTGLLDAGVASAQLVATNGLGTIRSLGDAGFEIGGIALDEVTFQLNNAVTGLSAVATQLGHASGSATVETAIGAAQGLAIAPALGAFNLGSGAAHTVLASANTGFDQLLDGATGIVNPTADAGLKTTRALPSEKPIVSEADSETTGDVIAKTSPAEHAAAAPDRTAVGYQGRHRADDGDGAPIVTRLLRPHRSGASDDSAPRNPLSRFSFRAKVQTPHSKRDSEITPRAGHDAASDQSTGHDSEPGGQAAAS